MPSRIKNHAAHSHQTSQSGNGLVPPLTIFCLALASTAQATSLLDAVNAARDFDVGIAAARNAVSWPREAVSGRCRPSPARQIDGNYAKQDRPDATYASTVRRHGYSASITQPFFDLSRIADFKRGNALAAQAEAEFSKAQQELITQVSNAYFDAHRLETIRRADRVIMLDRRKTIEVSPDQVWTAT
ncbi:TolC family protein [Ralstonia sp. TCR112]|uniref:TolC family protein n=1 Tax=Ralstonia sp. TCR112 TaxID=2601730 RepID=UPI0021C4B8CD|nr:TolC family protein [Ralstonia sp. TCR112]